MAATMATRRESNSEIEMKVKSETKSKVGRTKAGKKLVRWRSEMGMSFRFQLCKADAAV